MSFESSYQAFIEAHERRGGADRLRNRHGHAERLFLQHVWWPAFHHFTDLYPECEVRDFRDGSRYIDFAYIKPNYRMAIEIDGFGSHWKDISRWKFGDHIHRQNYLVIDGWQMIRIPFHDIEENPRLCQSEIQQLLGRLTGDVSAELHTLSPTQREIVRFIARSARPTSPTDIGRFITLNRRSTARHLRLLAESGWLRAAGGGTIRVRTYELHPSRQHIQI